jgi:4-hydroxy-2-oxoheptanedioate aldolase
MDRFNLKQRLASGAYLLGPFVRIPDPAVTEILGYAGFDFMIIDTEHGPLGVHQAENLVRAAALAGTAPIIRVRENAESMIVRALDTGAAGVQIPQVNSAEAAKAAIAAAKFYPDGCRGVCRFTRNAEYSHIPTPGYFPQANENELVVIMIEGAGGIREIDAILDVPGIDVVFLGPYDLSQALGVTGQVTHSKVLQTIESITKKARDRGIVVGSFADRPENVRRQRAMGIQYLSYCIDTGLIYESAKAAVDALKSSL